MFYLQTLQLKSKALLEVKGSNATQKESDEVGGGGGGVIFLKAGNISNSSAVTRASGGEGTVPGDYGVVIVQGNDMFEDWL